VQKGDGITFIPIHRKRTTMPLEPEKLLCKKQEFLNVATLGFNVRRTCQL
jgi:hypothetical protein